MCRVIATCNDNVFPFIPPGAGLCSGGISKSVPSRCSQLREFFFFFFLAAAKHSSSAGDLCPQLRPSSRLSPPAKTQKLAVASALLGENRVWVQVQLSLWPLPPFIFSLSGPRVTGSLSVTMAALL